MESANRRFFRKMHLPTMPDKGIFFIAVSQFGIAFSFNCIMAFMPFYILRISPFGTKETMIWIGLIMGAAHVFAGLTATLGFLNSSRFFGNAIGPFLATSILAFSNLLTLYLIIAGMTFVALLSFLISSRMQQISFSTVKPAAQD
jgi:hypothetical protein